MMEKKRPFGGWKPKELSQADGFGGMQPVEGVPSLELETLARQQAYQNALGETNVWKDFNQNPLGYFAGSVLSSVPELFGAPVDPRIQAWRTENPVTGFISQMVGPVGVYGAAYKLSKLPRMAAALETGTARTLGAFGVEAGAAAPVRTGIVKEILRYTPLELSRLGTGFTVFPDNFDELFADVGISTAVTGVFGGFGGWLRSGGKALEQVGKVADAELGLMPTFHLRIGMMPESKVTAGDKGELLFNLRQEVLDMQPAMSQRFGGKKVERYVRSLEDSNDTLDALVNSMFKQTTGKKAPAREIKKLFEGDLTDLGTLNVGEQALVVQSAGFKNIDELASTLVYPRLMQINDARFASDLAKNIDNTTALRQMADGVLVGKEQDGLFLVMKRLSTGTKTKKFGSAKIANGDRWLIGKTDQLDKFAPSAHKVFSSNVEQWSRLKESFQQSKLADPFNAAMDAIQRAMSPVDFEAMQTLGRKEAERRLVGRVAQKLKDEAGIADSYVVKTVTDNLFDIFAPTQFKEMRNSTFARLYGLLRGSVQQADTLASKISNGQIVFKGTPSEALRAKNVEWESGFEGYTPIRDLWARLTDQERQLVALASNTQTPADDLARLVEEGQISPRAAETVKELQNINQSVLEKIVMPALENAGMKDQFKWLEGYILPRVFKGDFQIRVEDATGALKWLASGTTIGAAQKEARAVIAEAAEKGMQWAEKPAESFAISAKNDGMTSLDDIVGMIQQYMTADVNEQAVVKSALRKLNAAKAATLPRTGMPNPKPGFTKARSGVAGSPDAAQYSLEDVVKASDNHYKQMLRLAAFVTWKSRFGEEAMLLKGSNEVAYSDLMRKAGTFMGLEGESTKWLNKTLAPVLGNVLGNKAATKIAAATNEMMYLWNLGIVNPTFAVLNMLTPLQTVVPWVDLMLKAPEPELAKLMQFVPKMGADGMVRGQVGVLDPLKVLGQSIRQLRKPSAEQKAMLEQLVSDGTLAPHLYDEFAGGGAKAVHTLQEAHKLGGGWGFIKEASTMLATKSEQFSRMIAANAAYTTGKHYLGLEGDQLYRFVKRGVEVTMYGYSVADRARIMTGPIGSMFGLFKNWQFHFIGHMANYAGLGMREGIWGPMLWQGGAALAIGGLGATPLKMAADGLAKMATDSPTAYHWLQDKWGDDDVGGADLGDAIYFGLPALFGVSLQASSMMPGTDVRNEITNMGNFVFWERAKQMGKWFSDADAYSDATGRNALADPNLRDQFLSAFAPRAVFRAFSAAEGDYIKSMATGYPQVRDVSLGARMLHGAGFNMVEIEQHQVAAKELWKQQEKRRAMVQNLGKEYAAAQDARDFRAMTDVMRKAMLLGIDSSSVVKSGLTRADREQGSIYDRYDAAAVAKYQSALGGF